MKKEDPGSTLENRNKNFAREVDESRFMSLYEKTNLKIMNQLVGVIDAIRTNLHESSVGSIPHQPPAEPVMDKERLRFLLDLIGRSSVSHTVNCPSHFRGTCHCGFWKLHHEISLLERLAK